jgi:hypothetical protein
VDKALCGAKTFPLETFLAFHFFSPSERWFMEVAMTMRELLTLAAVMSIAMTIAMWKNNNGGGWF